MTSSRKLLGFMASILLVAFSLPALADSGDKFSAVMSPASPPAQSGPITFTATIKNLARFDYLKSYTVTVPAGLTISGTPTASSGSVSVSGQVVSVSGTLIAYTKTTQLTIKAALASTLSCGPNALLWGATAKGGLFVNNEVFTLDSSSVLQTTVTSQCTLTITSQPSSAALNVPFDVTVGINPGPATVAADTSACGNASVATKSSSQTSATLTFTIPATSTITTCTLAFSAANYSSPPPVSLKVLAGQVSMCAPPSGPPPAGSQFTASCGGADGINVTGFAAGIRGPNKTGTCDPLNFTLTNNICGAALQQDANGNFIPPNAVSFVWDQSSQTAAFTYTVTWEAEYVDPGTGLPVQGRTQYCTGPTAADPTNFCATTRTLKACIGSAVAFASIPPGEPACSSEEDWATVSQTECAALTNPNGDNPPPACIRATTTIIDAKDPPIIRG